MHSRILRGKELYVTLEGKALDILSNAIRPNKYLVEELSSPQEETDGKIVSCAPFAFQLGLSRVDIITINTAIAILAIFFQYLLQGEIYLEYDTSAEMEIYNSSSYWIGHCDSRSCFHVKGVCVFNFASNLKMLH